MRFEELHICRNKHGRVITKSSNGLIFGRSPFGYRHLEYDVVNGRWKRWEPKSLIRIGVTNLE
jgi:hypothetical protein